MDQLREIDPRFHNHLRGTAWRNRPKGSQPSSWINSRVSTWGFTTSWIRLGKSTEGFTTIFMNWLRGIDLRFHYFMDQFGEINPKVHNHLCESTRGHQLEVSPPRDTTWKIDPRYRFTLLPKRIDSRYRPLRYYSGESTWGVVCNLFFFEYLFDPIQSGCI